MFTTDINNSAVTSARQGNDVSLKVEDITPDTVDFIVRVQGVEDEFQFSEIPTSEFKSFIDNIKMYCSSLNETFAQVFNYQRNLLDYKDMYISMLSGLMSEEDFDTSIEKFIIERSEKPDISFITKTMKIIDGIDNVHLEDDELSDMFRCSIDAVLQAKCLIENKKGDGCVETGSE